MPQQPPVLALNLSAAPQARTALETALGGPGPADRLSHLARGLGAEMSLKALGMPDDGLQTVIEQALAAPYANPKPVTEADLRHVVGNAFIGAAPTPRPAWADPCPWWCIATANAQCQTQ